MQTPIPAAFPFLSIPFRSVPFRSVPLQLTRCITQLRLLILNAILSVILRGTRLRDSRRAAALLCTRFVSGPL